MHKQHKQPQHKSKHATNTNNINKQLQRKRKQSKHKNTTCIAITKHTNNYNIQSKTAKTKGNISYT